MRYYEYNGKVFINDGNITLEVLATLEEVEQNQAFYQEQINLLKGEN